MLTRIRKSENNMGFFGRWVKVWAVISLLSLSAWAVYGLRSSYIIIYSLIMEGQSNYIARQGIAFWAGTIGYHTRFFAGLIGALTIALMPSKLKGSKKINKLLALVIVLDALYFALLLPYFQYLLSFGFTGLSLFLAYSYVVQPVAAAPFLFFLAYKVWKYDCTPKAVNMWKWAGIAFAGYIIALWSNMTMGRWFDMLYTEGLAFLESMTVSAGFFTSTILMALAVVFSVIAVFLLLKQQRLKAKMYVGMALSLVGLHYIFYTFYSFYVGLSLDWLMLVDVWAIPFFGLGIALILNKSDR